MDNMGCTGKKPLINMMFRFVVVECGVALGKHVLMGENGDFYYQHLRFQCQRAGA